MMQKKDERVGLVLSTTEKLALRQLADAEGGLSQAATLRRLIRAEAQRRGIWPTAEEPGIAEQPEVTA
jgi:hypothetical protein